jgi:hypothetical protein
LTGPGAVSPASGTSTTYTPPATAAAATTASLTASADGYTSAQVIISVGVPAVTITIAPPGPLTVQCGAAATSFQASLTGATGAITWELTGPGSLSATNGVTTNYTPPPSASCTPGPASLKASGGGVSATVSITVPVPSTITVSGVVVGENLMPASNCSVAIKGRPVATTGDDGKFTISGVTAPYDLVAVNTSLRLAVMYVGLTRTDPHIYFWGFTPGTIYRSGTVEGSLGGSQVAAAAPPGYLAPRVTFGATNPAAFGVTTALAAAVPATYSFSSIAWYGSGAGSGATTGQIDALQWQVDANLFPTGNYLYGSRTNVALANGASLSLQNVTLGTVAPHSFSGNVSVLGSNSTLYSKYAWVDFPTGGYVPIVADLSAQTSFSYVTPAIAGPNASISAQASVRQLVPSEGYNYSYAYKEGLATNASNVVLEVQDPPNLSNPSAGGADIDYLTEFRWQTYANALQIAVIYPQASGPAFAIFTMAGSANIPNLTEWNIDGMGLPHTTPQTVYNWYVLGEGPFASIDAAAGVGLWFPTGGVQNVGDSLTRTFSAK